jgi:hypothetical protein
VHGGGAAGNGTQLNVTSPSTGPVQTFSGLLVTKNRKVRQCAHPSEDEGQLERLQQEPQQDDAEQSGPTRDRVRVLAQIVQT